jgi:hypothetical protein
MAGFGSEYARFLPFDSEETDLAAPVYGTPVSLGPLATGNLAITNASGEQYGENKLQESIDKFASGAIPMEVTDLPKTSAATVFGATYNAENSKVDYGADDTPPYGALQYIRNILRNGVEIFEANHYTKARAARPGDPTQTRSGSITLQNTTINWKIMAPLHTDTKWQYTAEFATRALAIAYLDLIGGTNSLIGGTAAGETESLLAGEDLTADPIFSGSPEPTTGITYLWQYFNAGVWTSLTESYAGYNTDTLTTVNEQDEDLEFRCAITYNGMTAYTNSLIMT